MRVPLTSPDRQRLLPFDGTKETKRLKPPVERILGTVRQVQTAARYFTEETAREADGIARSNNGK